MKKLAPLFLATAFLLPGALAHAQALGQPCPDFTCDLNLVCIGTPPNQTCEPNAATPSASGGQSCPGGTDSECTDYNGQDYVCEPFTQGNGICVLASTYDNASLSGVGGSCTDVANSSDCRGGLQCDPNAHTCQYPGSSGLGGGGTSGGTPAGTSNTPGAGGINTQYIKGYSDSIIGIINGILLPLLIAVAFIFFLWGAFKYFIYGAADPESRKTGAQFVLYAVIGFVLIFSLWGLVNLLMGTLSLTPGGTHPQPPQL
jgi:hypothetical protein